MARDRFFYRCRVDVTTCEHLYFEYVQAAKAAAAKANAELRLTGVERRVLTNMQQDKRFKSSATCKKNMNIALAAHDKAADFYIDNMDKRYLNAAHDCVLVWTPFGPNIELKCLPNLHRGGVFMAPKPLLGHPHLRLALTKHAMERLTERNNWGPMQYHLLTADLVGAKCVGAADDVLMFWGRVSSGTKALAALTEYEKPDFYFYLGTAHTVEWVHDEQKYILCKTIIAPGMAKSGLGDGTHKPNDYTVFDYMKEEDAAELLIVAGMQDGKVKLTAVGFENIREELLPRIRPFADRDGMVYLDKSIKVDVRTGRLIWPRGINNRRYINESLVNHDARRGGRYGAAGMPDRELTL